VNDLDREALILLELPGRVLRAAPAAGSRQPPARLAAELEKFQEIGPGIIGLASSPSRSASIWLRAPAKTSEVSTGMDATAKLLA
jgi:hypothetical protein